ncbi:hypothetical protein ACJJIW_13450 [Microbulbifer sp. JMSA004]|uniref:hypothetical protein n=1 Tax=Microbulbifer sp. JMSA004 TaxID=3243370 RepID=UPI004039EE90
MLHFLSTPAMKQNSIKILELLRSVNIKLPKVFYKNDWLSGAKLYSKGESSIMDLVLPVKSITFCG